MAAKVPPTTLPLPGARAGGGHAVPYGLCQLFVARVDAVNGAQMRGDGVRFFVKILILPDTGGAGKADVAVRLHASGGHKAPLGIDDGGAHGSCKLLADSGNSARIVDQQSAVFKVGTCHGFDISVLDEKHKKPSFISCETSIAHSEIFCNTFIS